MHKVMVEDHKKITLLPKHHLNQDVDIQLLHTKALLSFLEVMILKSHIMMFTCLNNNPL
jgi:hypothetical protein